MSIDDTVDIEALLAPLGDSEPSGSDLEYDARFMALERLATPRQERAVGDSVIAAEEPEWARVEEQALALLGDSRDLRLAVHLCAAWVRQRGIAGWADGMALVRGLLERHWDSVHPQLDAEDDNDPTARVNALLPLADIQGALGYLRTAYFVQSPLLGRFTLRDLKIAAGTLKAVDGEQAAPLSSIEACCLESRIEDLERSATRAAQALEEARAIDALLTERLGVASPELKPLLDDLVELDRFVRSQWQARGGGDDEAPVDAGDEGGAAVASAATGKIGGREDVLRRIDEICEYYATNEPSSPVPILLKRARRLVGKGFGDLLQDLAPAGAGELRVFVGEEDGND